VKGKKTDLSRADCAIARSLDVIGDWWSLLLIRDAFLGKSRFGEFHDSLGMARNILSSRLKKLVAEGIFETVPDGPYSRYVLTERGQGLSVVLTALWQWGEAHCFRAGELKRTLVDRQSGLPIARLAVRADDGRELGPRQLAFGPGKVMAATEKPRR
jgi:DNA-binding HxlR family transcriptional regulator